MRYLKEFYSTKVKGYTRDIEAFNQRIFLFSVLRLVVFVATIIALYYASVNVKYVMSVLLVGVPLFLFLVSRHTDLTYQKSKKEALRDINSLELHVLKGDYSGLPDGKELAQDIHHYSKDIDLFGKGSFYQISNRTKLQEGSKLLASLYTENDIRAIPVKQEAIKELASKVSWRQEFAALAALTKTETPNTVITNWLQSYVPFVPKLMQYLPFGFSAISLGVFFAYFFNLVPESMLLLWLAVGIVIVGRFSAKVMKLGRDASTLKSTFDQYNQLLALIETTDFSSTLLNQKKEAILSKGVANSKVLKRFAVLLSNLDRNNNVLYLIFANGFFLRSLTDCLALENWIRTHGNYVAAWLDTIAFFDAFSSLGNFAFNHPTFTYPSITSNNVLLKAKNAGHPLLDPVKSVLNDISIKEGQFFIITGANMAGKSTFLRTVSLQIMMANVGLPVCADEVSYTPIKLITSMRTTDSLTDDESYFFSELKRLRFIVDEIQKDRYFIVLDEILKGTNSTDKALGSRKFLERLVHSKATGIIATHDLSLCDVANDFSSVKNHYFDAEISNNELYFDYTFKDGICQNMNASFLLKKMGIVE